MEVFLEEGEWDLEILSGKAVFTTIFKEGSLAIIFKGMSFAIFSHMRGGRIHAMIKN